MLEFVVKDTLNIFVSFEIFIKGKGWVNDWLTGTFIYSSYLRGLYALLINIL